VPSSMIFVGLVVMWLLILVPAVARRRQEVARPSATALAGRVLERSPCREPEPDREQAAGRDVEVNVRHELEPARTVATRTEVDDRHGVPAPSEANPRPRNTDRLDGWSWRDDEEAQIPAPRSRGEERPSGSNRAGSEPPRYRPGRGGYDPHAAALTARARYAFRRRMVLALLILAVGTAVAAAFTLPQLWWGHGAADLLLVGYLVYLRRQVRVEESIRRRRAARMDSPRRVADDVDSDERSGTSSAEVRARRSGGPAGARFDDHADVDDAPAAQEVDGADLADGSPAVTAGYVGGSTVAAAEKQGTTPTTSTTSTEPVDEPPALPRRKPLPLPPVPIGTTLVDTTEEDPSLHELECLARPDYRRASGQ
jgi:hypothetical protein